MPKTFITIRMDKAHFDQLKAAHKPLKKTTGIGWGEWLLSKLRTSDYIGIFGPVFHSGEKTVKVSMSKYEREQLEFKFDQFCSVHGLRNKKGKKYSEECFRLGLLMRGEK